MKLRKTLYVLLRIVMAFIVLWAFFDKLLGLGRATPAAKAWIHGGSPTSGFLMSLHGTFAPLFNSLAGVAIVDWLFMIGLLVIGLALLFNRYMKLASVAGSILFALMFLAEFPPANNPLFDEHIVYILVLLILGFTHHRGISKNTPVK